MEHVQFHLSKGVHATLTEAREVCLLEASIVTAGFPYRPVYDATSCPDCFSRPLATLAILLNEAMPDELRQDLLMPFITRLPFTAAGEEIEQARGEFLALATCRRIIAPFCVDVLKLDVAEEFYKTAITLEDTLTASQLIATETSSRWGSKVAKDGMMACRYACDRRPRYSAYRAGKAVTKACAHSRKRQGKYFPVAAQILDEAIKLGKP